MVEIEGNSTKNCFFNAIHFFLFGKCPNSKYNCKSQCAKLLVFCHMYNPILVNAA